MQSCGQLGGRSARAPASVSAHPQGLRLPSTSSAGSRVRQLTPGDPGPDSAFRYSPNSRCSDSIASRQGDFTHAVSMRLQNGPDLRFSQLGRSVLFAKVAPLGHIVQIGKRAVAPVRILKGDHLPSAGRVRGRHLLQASELYVLLSFHGWSSKRTDILSSQMRSLGDDQPEHLDPL